MDKKLSRKAIIASARKDIKSLPRPAGVSWIQWVRVTTLLHCLAGHLPEPYPSGRVLAEKLDWSQPTVHRAVSKARSLGLLKTSPRPNIDGHWDGTNYLLTCLSDTTKAAIVRARPGHILNQVPDSLSSSKVVPSSSKKESSPTPPSEVCAHGSAGSGLAAQTHAAAMARRDDWEPDGGGDPVPFGADPEAPLPSRSVKPPDPAKGLALHFDEQWLGMARRSRQWKGFRPSNRGMAIGYLKGVMLTQCDPDTARAHMNAFVSAVASGEVEIKEGQLPFERFTGWWGREPVADPAEQERLRSIIGALRQKQQAEREALDDDA